MTSPPKSKRGFDVLQDGDKQSSFMPTYGRTINGAPLALTTSRLANKIVGDSSKYLKTEENDVLDELMAKLSQQQLGKEEGGVALDEETSSNITDPYSQTQQATSTATSDSTDSAEVDRMKQQLDFANERMAQMELELTQSRLARHTVEQAIGSPFPNAQAVAFTPARELHVNPTAPHGRRPAPLNFNNAQHAQMQSMPTPNSTMTPAGYFGNQNDVPSPFARRSPGYVQNPRQTGYTTPTTPQFPGSMNSAALNPGFAYQTAPQMQSMQAPVGIRLSPNAPAFNGNWQGLTPQHSQQYMNSTEPLNYRRLLDRNMSCDYHYIVEKIVVSNDQQASIFLQQKLKVGTTEHKHAIVDAIVGQAFPLMINRFGNFLVQRCFEHGTPDQVISIAKAIRGNTLNLSMDAFGCHVVQKAFDSVPEEYKTVMVHELLFRIPDTVVHRYACHVWQKLFELRWSGSPPQIMKYVNEALHGMWHEVALGETGSLVVQNIFENCLESDKRPCINEVLASIDVVAHGQFGNWCIQHLCEHGPLADRTRAVDHVLHFAAEYSMDQYASKVVEKCLKIGGTDFLDRFLDRVCEAHPERPRMALIDISGDQFGNYLIQWILSNADAQRREVVASHVRKHMVSLRGSKYGSRVAMLCTNPASTTRPGPPTSLGRNAGRLLEQQAYGPQFPHDRGFIGTGRHGYYR